MPTLPAFSPHLVRRELGSIGVDAVRPGAPVRDVTLLVPEWHLYDVEVEWSVDLEDAEATAQAAGLEVLRTVASYSDHDCPSCECEGPAVTVVRSVGRHPAEAREQIVGVLAEHVDRVGRRHPLVAIDGGAR